MLFESLSREQQIIHSTMFLFKDTKILICENIFINVRSFIFACKGNEHKWIGPGNISRLFETITVQAKAWRSRDLPPITWKSQAINVSTSKFIYRPLIVLSVKEKLLEDPCFSGWYLVNSIEHTV